MDHSIEVMGQIYTFVLGIVMKLKIRITFAYIGVKGTCCALGK